MMRKACFIYLGESIVTQYQLAATGGAIAWGRDGTVIPLLLCESLVRRPIFRWLEGIQQFLR